MTNEPFPRIRVHERPRGVIWVELPPRKPEAPVRGTAEWYEAELLDFVQWATYWQGR